MQLSFRKVSGESGLRSLAELGHGEAATLLHLDLPHDFANRLMELGFLPGSPVCAAFSAPGGDRWGLLLSKGSGLTPCVDRAVSALQANGTLGALSRRWIASAASVPVLH